MVLELLIGPRVAEQKPWQMIFFGMLYASIGLFLSLWVFPAYASIVMVFLTVLASLYLVQRALRLEEHKDMKIKEELLLLKEHGRALAFLMFMFIGFVLAFSLWYMVLPTDMVNQVFDVQIKTIQQINTISSVDASAVQQAGLFNKIFSNNIQVLLFSILFAFFYGAGAVFILVWNASVVPGGSACASVSR